MTQDEIDAVVATQRGYKVFHPGKLTDTIRHLADQVDALRARLAEAEWEPDDRELAHTDTVWTLGGRWSDIRGKTFAELTLSARGREGIAWCIRGKYLQPDAQVVRLFTLRSPPAADLRIR